MIEVYPVTYILSANHIVLLKSDLLTFDIPCKEVFGQYVANDGSIIDERSIVVVTTNEDYILTLAKKYGQESILKLDPTRGAELIYTADNSRKYIGTFKPVSKDVALSSKGFTYDTENDQYYTVVKG